MGLFGMFKKGGKTVEQDAKKVVGKVEEMGKTVAKDVTGKK